MLQRLRFHHIGLACRDLAVDRRDHEFLGYVAEGEVFDDPLQRVRSLFMTLGPMRVELLEALDESSPLHAYLHRGVKIYHECFLCPDFDQALASLQSHRARLAGDPKPAIAFQNRRIAFVLLPSQTLIELIESGDG
ncbi:MAG TPA: VOC family protein [Pirellulales bacterium]|nr:VOC family protein [Pirellulales bacterium]